MEQKFYICKHCGNIIEKVEDKGVPVVCCGEVMQELQAGIDRALSFAKCNSILLCKHKLCKSQRFAISSRFSTKRFPPVAR